MAGPSDGERGGEQRRRPTHWASPVDERRRRARARRHRRRNIALAVAVAALVMLVGVYLYLTSDERVEKFAETYLESLLGTHVGIERASFSLTDGLVLENLRVAAPAPFREPILMAEQVDLRIDPLALIRFRLEVKEMVVRRPLISLILWDGQVWNFQAMVRGRPPERMAPPIRPRFAVDQGTVRIRHKMAGETVYEHTMQVSGLLLPSEKDPDIFRFQTDVTSRQVHLAVASGLLNARTGVLRLEGQASNVVLSPELYRSLPREARRVWDRFQPAGSVNLKVLFDEQDGFRLVTDLTGVRFAYQVQGRTHRFENLTGRCTLTRTGLELSGVQGLFDGSSIRRAEGKVAGFDRKRLQLNLSVRVDNVDLQKSRTIVEALAPHLAALYEQYAPKGRADVDLVLETPPQAAEDAPPGFSGVVHCREVEMTYARFPYRLERLRGAIRFGPDGFETDGLAGFHGESPVRVVGWAKNPGPRVQVKVTVWGRNVRLDEDLRSALSPAQRAAYDRYAPAGVVDVVAEIHRPPVEGARPQAVVRIDLLGCDLKYEVFPYQITGATGKVVLSPGRTEIKGVRGRHGRASIRLDGEVVAQEDGPPRIDLRVAGTDILLDDDLEAALPQRERTLLRVFHLSGLADIEGQVLRNPETENRLDCRLTVDLKGARMIHEAFPFLAENVTGRLHVARGSCRIESLKGFNAGARLEARGWIEQRLDDYALDVELTGEDVLLDEQLRGAVGPAMRAGWRHVRPHGRVDLKAHLTKAFGRGETLKHHVWVTAKGVRAMLDVFPYPLEHLTGRLEFQGDEVRLHDVAARNGPAEFVLGGRILYATKTPQLDLSIRARWLRLEGPLRRALPGPLRKAFAWLQPTGRVDLNLERLVYRSVGEDSYEAVWSASAILDDVRLAPGIVISGVVGTAEAKGRWVDGRVGLEGGLWIQQGKIGGKEVSDTRLLFKKEEAGRVLLVRSVEGAFYGGRFEGFGRIHLGPGGRYGFSLAADDVDFERLLRDGFRLEHNVTGGRLRATLAVRAGGRSGETFEAAGYAYVTEARLYELPLVVRILNLLRLAPPDRTAFRRARVRYFVRGKRIFLTDIRLEGRAMNLYGAGTVEPDGALELSFVTGRKDEKPLVPALTELVEGLRKELVVVEVTGTLSKPRVRTRSLLRLTAPLRELVDLVREQRRRGGG